MVDRMKDAEDLKLESLFASDPIADGGFSTRIEKRIRRQLWVRRLALPVALIIGGSIAVTGTHETRTRQSGQTRFVQLHLELNENMSLRRAHEIADQVEAEIMAVLPGSEVLIHQDPIDDSAPLSN